MTHDQLTHMTMTALVELWVDGNPAERREAKAAIVARRDEFAQSEWIGLGEGYRGKLKQLFNEMDAPDVFAAA